MPVSTTTTLKPLPVKFSPGRYDVVCARGNEALKHPGNIWYHQLLSESAEEYSRASNRSEKIGVISSIMSEVKKSAGVGGFVRYQDGRWYEVSNEFAREKVGQNLRNILCDQYKSSEKAKLKNALRRKDRERMRKKGPQIGSALATYQANALGTEPAALDAARKNNKNNQQKYKSKEETSGRLALHEAVVPNKKRTITQHQPLPKKQLISRIISEYNNEDRFSVQNNVDEGPFPWYPVSPVYTPSSDLQLQFCLRRNRTLALLLARSQQSNTKQQY